MKLTTMQRKYLLRAAMVFLLIAGSFIVLWSSSRAAANKKDCTESMEECSEKIKKNTPSGEMIWETLSHQFFSTVETSNWAPTGLSVKIHFLACNI